VCRRTGAGFVHPVMPKVGVQSIIGGPPVVNLLRTNARLAYQHTIPIAEEPIPFPDRFCVRFKGKLATGIRSDQH
jgi:hypothetical protein